MAATFLSLKSMSNMNPMTMAISVLAISLVCSAMILKTGIASWVCFVLILTFSSGMMTLFMYTASMTANEKSNTKKHFLMIPVVLTIMMITPNSSETAKKESMLTFSNKMIMMIMGTALILTMLGLSSHGFHPNQTVSASF